MTLAANESAKLIDARGRYNHAVRDEVLAGFEPIIFALLFLAILLLIFRYTVFKQVSSISLKLVLIKKNPFLYFLHFRFLALQYFRRFYVLVSRQTQ